jgi:hypothetical protein
MELDAGQTILIVVDGCTDTEHGGYVVNIGLAT